MSECCQNLSKRIKITYTAHLLFDFLDVVNISVKEVSHGVSNGRVFETRSDPKHSDVRHGGAQLSHSLTLKIIAVIIMYQWLRAQRIRKADINTNHTTA